MSSKPKNYFPLVIVAAHVVRAAISKQLGISQFKSEDLRSKIHGRIIAQYEAEEAPSQDAINSLQTLSNTVIQMYFKVKKPFSRLWSLLPFPDIQTKFQTKAAEEFQPKIAAIVKEYLGTSDPIQETALINAFVRQQTHAHSSFEPLFRFVSSFSLTSTKERASTNRFDDFQYLHSSDQLQTTEKANRSCDRPSTLWSLSGKNHNFQRKTNSIKSQTYFSHYHHHHRCRPSFQTSSCTVSFPDHRFYHP